MPRRLVVGNWKMHGTLADMAELRAIDAAARNLVGERVRTIVCPPFPLLCAARASAPSIAIGAQDCHAADCGAQTGGVSAVMLADCGAEWVILGHSEIRAGGRLGDADVAARLSAAQTLLRPILCVGEEARGEAAARVADQLLRSIPADADATRLAVAYEPVWAIGSGETPTAEAIARTHAVLRAALIDRFAAAGAGVPILYGGSVGPANADAIATIPGVDGVLVGGASLRAATFEPIMAAMTTRGGNECVAA